MEINLSKLEIEYLKKNTDGRPEEPAIPEETLTKLRAEKLEIQAAFYYLTHLGVTLWGDWLITDPKQRLAAARWLGHASAEVRKVRRNGNFKPY